jgi:hypothetical protein
MEISKNNMEYPSAAVDQIRELHRSTAREAKRLREQAEVAEQRERVWANLEQFIAKGWTLHILEQSLCSSGQLPKNGSSGFHVVDILHSLERCPRK